MAEALAVDWAARAASLRAGAAAGRWREVLQLDAELAQALRVRWPAGVVGGVDAAERAQLQQLARLHDELREDCARALQELGEQLSGLRAQHAARSAYAQSLDWSPEVSS